MWKYLAEQRDETITCGDLKEHPTIAKLADDEFLGYLEYFSNAGAIGLFPDA